MTLQEAIELVRKKYTDEMRGITSGLTAQRYADAIVTTPVLMFVASHHLAEGLKVGRTSRTRRTFDDDPDLSTE